MAEPARAARMTRGPSELHPVFVERFTDGTG
jgi:hypothetical protein